MKEGWTYKKLGEVCDILNGYAFKSSNYVEQGIRVIRITNVQKGYVVDDNPKYYPLSSIDEIRKYELKEGDLLMSLTGNVGRVGILDSSLLPAALNQRVACLRLKRDAEIIKQYIYHYLNSDFFEQECIKYATGAAQLNMSTVWLSKQQLPIPNIAEQERIVAYLDTQFAKIDAMKANAAKALAEAKALFQAALTEAMTPKEGWMMKKIDDIALNMFRGAGIKREQVTDTGTPCVRYGEIYTTYDYSFNECVSHTNEDEIKPKKYFEHGDLLFTLTGESIEDIGKCIAYLGHERCLLGGDILVMKHEQNPKFLAYALSTENARKQKGLGKVKLKVVHTNESSLRSVVIPLPSLSEQQAIVEHLDSLHAHLKALEANYPIIVAECAALKQALLREVFE